MKYTVICKNCSKSIERHLSHIVENNFCSSECFYTFRNKFSKSITYIGNGSKVKTKKCTTCKKIKNISQFYIKMKLKRKHIRSLCKKCQNKKNRKYLNKYIEKYPERNRARSMVAMAIKKGEIEREPCKVCKNQKVHAHHPDYSKPLYVVWLCRKHHEDVHHDKLKLKI